MLKISTLPQVNFKYRIPIVRKLKYLYDNKRFERYCVNKELSEKGKKLELLPEREKFYLDNVTSNVIGTERDYVNPIVKRVYYYPEDVEKMKNMTEEEKILFKRELRDQGKYYETDW